MDCNSTLAFLKPPTIFLHFVPEFRSILYGHVLFANVSARDQLYYRLVIFWVFVNAIPVLQLCLVVVYG